MTRTLSRRRASALFASGLLAAARLPCMTRAQAEATPSSLIYEVVDLGLPEGAQDVEASDLNAAGAVVGSVVAQGRDRHAFLWQDGLFRLLAGPEVESSHAAAINERFQIAGTVRAPDAASRAVLWDGDTTIDLGTLDVGNLPGTPFSSAFSINEQGHVVGSAGLDMSHIEGAPGGASVGHAFLWSDGRTTDLGTLGGVATALSVNASDLVVGNSAIHPGDVVILHAFLWDRGQLTDLGTLGGEEIGSEAWQINDRGQIVGGSTVTMDAEPVSTADEQPPWHAVLWDGGRATDLGTLADFAASTARGINNAGQIVGTASNPGTPDEVAVLWDQGQIVDLNALLSPNGDVTLRETVAINEAGQFLCRGWAGDDRRTRSFILTPTE